MALLFSVSAWAEDQFGCGLVPERSGDGEVFLVLSRLGCPFDLYAVDVESLKVACTRAVRGRALDAEAPAEALAVGFPSCLEDVDYVGNGPAVDELCWFEEVVEELGNLVGAKRGCKGVPKDEVDLVAGVGATRDVEDGTDGDGFAKWDGRV